MMNSPETFFLPETDSTNDWLRQHAGAEDCVVWTDFQTAGRGQGTNTWESERGKNLLFSILHHPCDVAASRQFVISMAISLALCDTLSQHIGGVSIKWPNDIYWNNAKIAGILIENRLHGSKIRESVIGVGLNVNQEEFRGDAPNPVSLIQIHGMPTDRASLLEDILRNFYQRMEQPSALHAAYMQLLYRRRGYHPYCDADGAFMAEIENVEKSGHLLLRDDNGRQRRYAFKQVQFVI